MSVALEFAFEARVRVAPPLIVGEGPNGLRRIVPILGGRCSGPDFEAEVLPGGADWQVVRADGVLQLEARYTLRLPDDTLVQVINRGMRHGSREVLDRIFRGETVDPREYYFRTVAEFEAPRGPHDWLNRALFLGEAERRLDEAIVRFHRVC
jgi:Protein of unknown function (DUF3237)